MFGNGFCHTIQDTLQIIQLTGILYFDDDNFVFTVACLDVYPVKLIVGTLLVSLTFENLHDLYLLAYQDGEKSFKHIEIRLLSQQALDGPVETNVSVLQIFHNLSIYIDY